MLLENTYRFPAIKGIMAHHEYYVVMCPMKLIPKIFTFDEPPIPPNLRAQRILNKARIPEIRDYILKNRRSYFFSSLTASVNSPIDFMPASASSDDSSLIGSLIIPMSSILVINDGQHRRAGIEAALTYDSSLGEEYISVVLFVENQLVNSQQLFADLNKHAVKPTKSLSVLYDQRDPLAQLTRDLADNHLPFKNHTEFEKSTISNNSPEIFTLSAIYCATAALLGRKKKDVSKISSREKTLCISYWETLAKIIPEWRNLNNRLVRANTLRQNYVHVHAVTLHSLGILGKAIVKEYPRKWDNELCKLTNVDWRRNNESIWEGRAMNGGQMSRTRQNVTLTANYLKQCLGLSLTEEEKKLEAKMSIKLERS